MGASESSSTRSAVGKQISAMKKNPSSAQIQLDGCRLMLGFAANVNGEENSLMIGRKKGIDVAIHAIQNHYEDVSIVRTACLLLRTMSKYEENVDLIRRGRALLESLSIKHGEDKYIMAYVEDIFRSMRGMNRPTEVIEGSGKTKEITIIVEAMKINLNVEKIQAKGLQTLLRLIQEIVHEAKAARGADRKQLRGLRRMETDMVDTGALDRILGAMAAHRESRIVQMPACMSLSWLCKHVAYKGARGMVGQRGGIHDLVLTLRDFSMDCDLTKVALWALNEVCRDSPSNVARLHIEGGKHLLREISSRVDIDPWPEQQKRDKNLKKGAKKKKKEDAKTATRYLSESAAEIERHIFIPRGLREIDWTPLDEARNKKMYTETKLVIR